MTDDPSAELRATLARHLPADDPLMTPVRDTASGRIRGEHGPDDHYVVTYERPDAPARSYSVDDDGGAVAVSTVEDGAMVTIVYADGEELGRRHLGPPEHN